MGLKDTIIHALIAGVNAATTLTLNSTENLPLEALPGKNVGGVYDVFSNLHTSSWG